MEDKQKENIKLNSNFDQMSCVGWLLVFASVSYACTLLFTKRTDSHHIDFNSTTYTLLSFNCIRLSGDQRLLVHLSKATQGPYGRRSMLVIILPLVHTTKPTAVPWWRGEWGKLVGVAMHDHTEHLSTHTKKKIEIEKIRNSVLYQWKRCTCSDIPISLADLLVIWIVKYTTRRTRKVIKAELTKLEKKKKTRIEEKYSPRRSDGTRIWLCTPNLLISTLFVSLWVPHDHTKEWCDLPQSPRHNGLVYFAMQCRKGRKKGKHWI